MMNNRTRIQPVLSTAVLTALGLAFSACQREALTEQQRDGVTFTVRTVATPATKSPDVAPAFIPVTGTDELFIMVEETLLQPDHGPADTPATKAEIHPSGALQKGAELGLVAYTYATDNAEASDWKVLTNPAVSPLILDAPGTGGNRTDGSGKWIPAPGAQLLWPREGFVRYFAFAPHSAVSGTFTDDKAPVLVYSIPESVTSQVDLLVSTPGSTRQYSGDPGWRNIDIPIDLQHALTGIRFRIVEGLIINSLKISGVYGDGKLDLSANPQSWALTGNPASTYTLTNPVLVADSGEDGFNLTNEANTFLLMPQTLPADAKIEVTVSMRGTGDDPVSGSERTISAVIGGQEWKPGTLVTYTITKDSDIYILEAPDKIDLDYPGGVKSMEVSSYKIVPGGQKTGVNWKLQVLRTGGVWEDVQSLSDIKDADNKPWVYRFPLSGTHTSEQKITYDLEFGALPAEVSPNQHTQTLRGRESVGTQENPVDLSLLSLPENGVRTAIDRSTANCYVVDRPGWYKIPMVYGNAIKDGADNPSAYNAVTAPRAGNPVYRKMDHSADGYIDAPWVSQKYDIEYARLLWTEMPGVVTNVGTTGTGKEERYVVFYVDPATIHQGNAIIAAFTSDGLPAGQTDALAAWSWHIWVTDADFTPVSIQVHKNETISSVEITRKYTYGMMRQDIGQVDGIEKRNTDATRNSTFRLAQVDGGKVRKTHNITIAQKFIKRTGVVADEGDLSYGPYAALYQWGRKDLSMGRIKPNEYYGFISIVGSNGQLLNQNYYTYDGQIVTFGRFESDNLKFNLGYDEASYRQLIRNPLWVSKNNQPSNMHGDSFDLEGSISYPYDPSKNTIYSSYYQWDNNPENFYTSLDSGNHLNIRGVVKTPIKTVYDPSPIGWCVPPYAVTGDLLSNGYGSNTDIQSLVTLEVEEVMNGRAIKTKPTHLDSSDYIWFYPATSQDNGFDSYRRWCCTMGTHKYSNNKLGILCANIEMYHGASTTMPPFAQNFNNAVVTSDNPAHRYAVRPVQESMSQTSEATTPTPANEGYLPDNTGWF